MAVPGCYNNLSLLLLSIFCLLTFTATTDSDVITKQAAQNWPNHGGDLNNRRYANKEKKISPETVSKLHLKWKFYAGGDISVTPAIFNDTIYFPSWNGNLYAVKASDGSLVWKKNLQKLTGFNNTGFVLNVNSTVSRSTPTIAGDLLLVGLFGPAVVIAVKKSNGNLVWSTRLDDHARGFITMSGTYYKGLVLAVFTLILFFFVFNSMGGFLY
ncbi:hypothetical protein LWI28_014480 [Acer negundo]|uniref:Pyrrolo-quinoline quinone repeat domain-containing protein n=1 Tax=Acer negundo TaxID=4023 RepID=A0AAD5NFL9_ACENE|nr:hypothetical protein LWI28_014480 [Acer negundo]